MQICHILAADPSVSEQCLRVIAHVADSLALILQLHQPFWRYDRHRERNLPLCTSRWQMMEGVGGRVIVILRPKSVVARIAGAFAERPFRDRRPRVQCILSDHLSRMHSSSPVIPLSRSKIQLAALMPCHSTFTSSRRRPRSSTVWLPFHNHPTVTSSRRSS